MPAIWTSRGRWSIMFVATLFLMCLFAAQVWQSDEAERLARITRAPMLHPVAAVKAAEQTMPDAGVAVGGSAPNRFDLGQYATAPTPAHTAPPVASKVTLRCSVPETPALPVAETEAHHNSVAKFHLARVPEISPNTDDRATQIPRAESQAVGNSRSPWPYPETLIDELAALDECEVTHIWATQVRRELGMLHDSLSLSSSESRTAIENLEQLTVRARALANDVNNRKTRIDLQRAAYSLKRRVLVWKLVAASQASSETFVSEVPPPNLDKPLAAVESRLENVGQRSAWRAYLMLDELPRVFAEASRTSDRREIASAALLRMNSASLSREQLEFLNEPEFRALAASLRRWANEPVDYRRLMRELERYERESTPDVAHQVAADINRLRWSDAPISELAELLDAHYRNANVRVAVSDAMLNRWIPKAPDISEPVHHQILGARVIGRSQATSELRVILIPDPNVWRIGLEAAGSVRSSTESSKGPAVFYNQGDSRYAARKLLLIDRHGVRVARAEAEADGDSRLTSVATEFDSLPLLNSLVRSIAMQEYEEKAPLARRRMNDLVAGRASERLDVEVHDRLMEVERQFKHFLLEPLKELNLNPTALEMETTETRLIARYRLAGSHQLAANTPRPQAPADSLLSLQLHESALNNTIEQMRFEGKRCDLPTLYREIVTTFRHPEFSAPADLPNDVTIQFAEKDPIRIRYVGGEVELSLRIAELNSPDRTWRNFTVKAAYRPTRDGMNADLARDEYVQIVGPELGFRDRLPLRAIFSTVFAKDRPIQLFADSVTRRPEFRDLQVTQFVVHDGWIGLAVGPQPPTDRTASPPPHPSPRPGMRR